MLLTGIILCQLYTMAAHLFDDAMGTFSLFRAKMDHLQAINTNINDMASNFLDPRLYAASLADKDTLHYKDAMT